MNGEFQLSIKLSAFFPLLVVVTVVLSVFDAVDDRRVSCCWSCCVFLLFLVEGVLGVREADDMINGGEDTNGGGGGGGACCCWW